MITVTVPATSANVGAGFDSLGLALSMHNVFTFEECDRIRISSVDGTGEVNYAALQDVE